MFVIVSRYLIPKGFRGMTIFPFIIVSEKGLKQNPVFINHEKIHIRQQLELLILPFFIWYGIEYLIRLLILKDRKQAYRNICFEKEAYKNESNLNYLSKRKFFLFIKHLSL